MNTTTCKCTSEHHIKTARSLAANRKFHSPDLAMISGAPTQVRQCEISGHRKPSWSKMSSVQKIGKWLVKWWVYRTWWIFPHIWVNFVISQTWNVVTGDWWNDEKLWLVRVWPTPLKSIKVSWDDGSKLRKTKTCSTLPNRWNWRKPSLP